MALVSSTTPPFEAQYATALSPPTSPHPELLLMITPLPCPIIGASAYFDIRNVPFRLMSICRSHSSSEHSSAVCGKKTPALLNRISSRPNERSVSSTARWHSAALRTSVRRKIVFPPDSRMRAMTAWPRDSLRPVMATFAPSCANSSATASPMPDVPPVIRATLFSRRMKTNSQTDPASPPPSTTSAVPVTNEDASLARYSAACAISSGVPTRPSGRLAASARKRLFSSPSCRASSRNMPVSVSPGQMQFTRMFCGPWSTAIAFVSSTTAPFDAQYTAAFAPPVRPHPEAVLMIEPPPAFCMCGITSRDSKKIDFTLTVITRSQSSSLRSRTVARRMMPALLNRMSILPNSRSVRSTTRRQSPARVISADSKHPRPPAFSISVAASCPVFAFTSAITISAPSLANNNAVARPIPEAPPVMIATLLASCISAAGKPSHSFSAVTGVHVPGYVGGVVRCEKREQRRNLLRLGVAAERNFLVHLFEHLVGVLGALHGCQDVTRGDRAYADFGSEFEGHGFRQRNYAGLGGVVVRVIGIAHHAVGRRCLENYAASALHHVARCCLGNVKNAGEVHGDHFVPLFRRDVEKVVTDADAGIVNQNIHCAHQASSFREGRLYLLQVRHVGGNHAR